jgi:hypothetical protein
MRRRSHGTQTSPESRGRLLTNLAKELQNNILSKEDLIACTG